MNATNLHASAELNTDLGHELELELRITNYELLNMNYELRITNYELRVTNYELEKWMAPPKYEPVLES